MESNNIRGLFKRSRAKILLLIILFSGSGSHAQTWSEWFSQKKTQKKYLLEQLAALKVYAGYAKKGYQIGSTGINFIRDLSKGEFDLHDTFISSLKTASPFISNNGRVTEIIALQMEINGVFAELLKNNSLSSSNLAYARLVNHNLLQECLNEMQELLIVVTSGKIEMPEGERLERLEGIYNSMQEKSVFAKHFSRGAKLLIAQKKMELHNLKSLEKWYEN